MLSHRPSCLINTLRTEQPLSKVSTLFTQIQDNIFSALHMQKKSLSLDSSTGLGQAVGLGLAMTKA